MTAEEREALAHLRLARTDRVGPATFRRLLRSHGSAERALAALPDLAARAGARRFEVFPAARAEEELAEGGRRGARLLLFGALDYPELLADIESAPAALWALGDPARVARAAVAIVGARNASALGLRLAAMLGADLAEAGVTVVSGLARGVDAAAHAGALEARSRNGAAGATVAVLAGGVEQIYPPENAALYREIAEVGVILSERPFGAEPMARDFPRRNRIVSGLSLGVVVVEAAVRSGSLITAEMALDQGREVMAAPGHPLDGRAAGGNRLIRDGAALIRSATDVLEALGPSLELGYPHRRPPRDAIYDPPGDADLSDAEAAALRARLLGLLGAAPTPLDLLIRSAGASAGAVAAALVELELAGRVEREPGGAIVALDPSALP